jgi:hypothetical protein
MVVLYLMKTADMKVPILLPQSCGLQRNIKDALTDLQMKLEGEHLQLQWKPAQKNNSCNQIDIYGLPPGFNPKGIMRELLFGLR